MAIHDISKIERCTVALYREKCGEYRQIGSGVLISFQKNYYLISAFHVFDMEEEQIQIENDPEEKGIPQDDLDGIMAKGASTFFYVNDHSKGLALSVYYDGKNGRPVFNEDTEWCVCELSNEMVQCFIDAGKSFYAVSEIAYAEIKSDSTIIISGYPKYAQKKNQEEYRSFYCETLDYDETLNGSELFRVKFYNKKAYSVENKSYIQLPNYGIAGMSGGGIWYEKNNRYIPIGIILKQDPNENYVEGYRIDEILKNYIKWNI